jgi:hypothetical protein
LFRSIDMCPHALVRPAVAPSDSPHVSLNPGSPSLTPHRFHAGGGSDFCQIMSEAEIVERQEEMVASVVSVLSVTESAAAILLRHFKWNVTRLHDHWCVCERAKLWREHQR